jgi:antitoxin MazE
VVGYSRADIDRRYKAVARGHALGCISALDRLYAVDTVAAMKTSVARWGNSLALRIPRGVAVKSRLAEGVEVELAAKPDGFVVRRSAPSYSLSTLLDGVRPSNRHAEVATGGARGGEVW